MRPCLNKTLFAALCAIAPAALATPPDIIDVRDELFGVSSCCVLTLRMTNDNLGVYDVIQRDVALIVTDRESQEETLYPVYRVRGRSDPDRDDGALAYTAAALPDSVDPFALLSGMNGAALSVGDGFLSAVGPVGRDGDWLTIAVEGGRVRVRMEDVLRRAEGSMSGLAAIVGDYDRPAPVATADLLEGRLGDGADCDFPEAWRLHDRTGGAPVILLRVECGPDWEGTSILTPLAVSSD